MWFHDPVCQTKQKKKKKTVNHTLLNSFFFSPQWIPFHFFCWAEQFWEIQCKHKIRLQEDWRLLNNTYILLAVRSIWCWSQKALRRIAHLPYLKIHFSSQISSNTHRKHSADYQRTKSVFMKYYLYNIKPLKITCFYVYIILQQLQYFRMSPLKIITCHFLFPN